MEKTFWLTLLLQLHLLLPLLLTGLTLLLGLPLLAAGREPKRSAPLRWRPPTTLLNAFNNWLSLLQLLPLLLSLLLLTLRGPEGWLLGGYALGASTELYGLALSFSDLAFFFGLMAQLVLVLTDLNFRCSPLEERSSEENQRPAFLGKLRRRHRALRGLYFGLNLALLQLLLQLFFYSDNLLVFFASFEASVLPIFLLMGFFGKRSQKFRAMAYLLFFTLLSALPLLLLLLELYQRSGTVHYGALLALQASGRLLSSAELPWAFMAFFLPFGVKMAWFPLHGWLPEAHVEASTEGSMLLSGVLLKVGFYGLLRCCLGLCGGAAAGLAPYLLTPALVGATIASLSAYRQLDLKKIIAYSSVVHMNLSLMGCFCLSSTALSAALLLNFGHAVVSAGLFAAVGALENRTRTRNLLELSGLDGVMPNWCLALLLLLLANAGFPGTVGFLGEAGLLWGCYQSFVWTPTLALPAVGLMGLRCLLLYAQLAWGVPAPFLNPTRLPELQSFPTHERLLLLRHWDVGYRRDGLVLTLLAGLSLLLGLWPQPLLVLLEQPALLLAGWGALPTTAVVGCINHLYLYAGANPALARVVPLSLTPYPLPLIPYPLSLTPYPLFLIPYSLSLTILTPYTLPPMPVFRTNQTNFNHQHPLLRPLATTAAPETKATETRKILAAQVPATLTTLERLARYRELGLPVPQRSPRLLRLLVISPAGEAQRAHLPLQKVTHPFFMAPYSEYPLLLGFSLLGVLGGTVNYLHHGFMGLASEPYLLLLLLVTLRWCGDLESLGNQPALYTAAVRRNLLLGIMLFILSEIMIFFALFWAFFHSALNPSAELGSVWPPLKLLLLEWTHWPTLNTALLVYSGGAANVGLYALQNLNLRLLITGGLQQLANQLSQLTPPLKQEQLLFGSTLVAGESSRLGQLRLQLHRVYGGFLYAVVCGALFLLCQLYEYNSASYAMSDGVYGSVFYGLTGLHGLHVLAGLLLLLLVLWRLQRGYFDRDQNTHDGPTGGVWYWHFVDVVWLVLFAVLYLWGNSRGEGLDTSGLLPALLTQLPLLTASQALAAGVVPLQNPRQRHR